MGGVNGTGDDNGKADGEPGLSTERAWDGAFGAEEAFSILAMVLAMV